MQLFEGSDDSVYKKYQNGTFKGEQELYKPVSHSRAFRFLDSWLIVRLKPRKKPQSDPDAEWVDEVASYHGKCKAIDDEGNVILVQAEGKTTRHEKPLFLDKICILAKDIEKVLCRP